VCWLISDIVIIALKTRKRSNRFPISLSLKERQKSRSVGKRGRFNVFRMINVDGEERGYVARKTHYWWLNHLRVDHRKAS
jgi:hypothetical protein